MRERERSEKRINEREKREYRIDEMERSEKRKMIGREERIG